MPKPVTPATPITPSPQPDPKVWKWCKHKECQGKIKAMFLLDAEDQQTEMRRFPYLCAVFDEERCWKHLPEGVKADYKTKIEEYLKHNSIPTGANFYEVELQQADLSGAYLQEAILLTAKLQKTQLIYVKLQNANLRQAKLQEADLRTAKLQEADLWRADLRGAELDRIELHGASLSEVQLDGAKNLTWECLRKLKDNIRIGKARIGEEKGKVWSAARDAYRNLKNYFHQQGLYEDEAKAYYREKLMAQREAWRKKRLGSWFVLFLLNTLAGFGEKLWRTIVSAFATILIFTGIYWFWGEFSSNVESIKNIWHCFYFSVVTFATLGFGDISPALHSTGTQIAAVIEVILGYVFLGMLITIIARKFGR